MLDIGLPGMDGYELARRLREICPDIRLIALTGYGQASDHEAALAAGFDAHLRQACGALDAPGTDRHSRPCGAAFRIGTVAEFAVAELKFRVANVRYRPDTNVPVRSAV